MLETMGIDGEGARPREREGPPSMPKGRIMEDQETIIIKGRLDGRQRNRLKRLLDMPYSPGELAEEIGIDKNQIYMVYVPLGCPHERDLHKRITINGVSFFTWYQKVYKKATLSDGETFCKTCKKAVKIVSGQEITKGELTYILSACPHCGRKLTRIIHSSRGQHG